MTASMMIIALATNKSGNRTDKDLHGLRFMFSSSPPLRSGWHVLEVFGFNRTILG